MSVTNQMKKLLGEGTDPRVAEEEGAPSESGVEDALMKNLALVAATIGINLDDDKQADDFITLVKTVVTKDKAKLKSLLRRFTASKAKTAAKGAMKAVQ